MSEDYLSCRPQISVFVTAVDVKGLWHAVSLIHTLVFVIFAVYSQANCLDGDGLQDSRLSRNVLLLLLQRIHNCY